MELKFFTVACTALCFEFETESVDNTPVSAIAEQCLHSIETFFVSHVASLLSSPGVGKRLEEDAARIVDLRDIWRLAVQQSACGMGSDCLFNLYVCFFSLIFPSLIKLSLSMTQKHSCFCSSNCCPHSD